MTPWLMAASSRLPRTQSASIDEPKRAALWQSRPRVQVGAHPAEPSVRPGFLDDLKSLGHYASVTLLAG